MLKLTFGNFFFSFNSSSLIRLQTVPLAISYLKPHMIKDETSEDIPKNAAKR